MMRAFDWCHTADNAQEAGSLCQVKSNNDLFLNDTRFFSPFPRNLSRLIRYSLHDSIWMYSQAKPSFQFCEPGRHFIDRVLLAAGRALSGLDRVLIRRSFHMLFGHSVCHAALKNLFTGSSPWVLRESYSESVTVRVLAGLRKAGSLMMLSATRKRCITVPSDFSSQVIGEIESQTQRREPELSKQFRANASCLPGAIVCVFCKDCL
ncbi:MAG: hypothetical protein K0U66_00465 [Gammaproteobacteria bacterium]|nr:hypothetical protein [Gammaproteobacteria bacterium]